MRIDVIKLGSFSENRERAEGAEGAPTFSRVHKKKIAANESFYFKLLLLHLSAYSTKIYSGRFGWTPILYNGRWFNTTERNLLLRTMRKS